METRQIAARDGDVLLLVGTSKGAFLLRSNAARTRWELGGPHFPGQMIYGLAWDAHEGRRRIWAGTTSEHWGPTLSASDDVGATWRTPDETLVRFPEGTDASVKRIWQITPGSTPGTLYAGVEPAALFESKDGGASWSLVRGLHDHPHRPQWQPGGGGLCLHTIVPHPTNPERLHIAISTGGVYRTDDGGRTWEAKNQGVRAEFMPDRYPAFGQCVHKVVMHPSRPDRLFLQNHWGLYRSDDAGDSWTDIARDVPSDFGFAMTMHPHDPDTVYIVPLESDQFRCTPEGRLRVFRTRDAGASWEALTRGLPQKDALETVLRDAMDADDLNPAGIYFGTRSGKLFGSSDGGASWNRIADGLPPVLCVKAAIVGDASRVRVPRRARKAVAKRGTRARAAGGRTQARARRSGAARGRTPSARGARRTGVVRRPARATPGRRRTKKK